MNFRMLFVLLLCMIPSGLVSQNVALDSSVSRGLEWRQIGLAPMGGRVTVVAGIPGDPSTVYVGSASGGIWKTTNGGVDWNPIFDDQPVSAIGNLAVQPGNPDVVYAG